MFFKRKACFMLTTTLLTASAAHAGLIPTDKGIGLQTEDDSFDLNIGGKLQYDITNFQGLTAASQSDHFGSKTDSIMRRAYLDVDGHIFHVIGYGLRREYERKDRTTDWTRAWLSFEGLSWAKVTVGRYKFGYGLEGASSSSWTTAPERPLIYDFMSGGDDVNKGIMLQAFGKNFSLAAQYFTNGDFSNDGADRIYSSSYRATFAPIVEPNQVLHFGIDAHRTNTNNNETKLRTRLETRTNADDRMRFADIESTTSDNEFGLEAAYQINGFRIQSEYFRRDTDGYSTEVKKKKTNYYDQNATIQGGYIQLSYMFGTQRGYDVENGRFTKPLDMNNTFEIFTRYENANIDTNKDATKKNINDNVDGVKAIDRDNGHSIKAYVLGVNYYYNKHVKATLSYSHSHISNIDTSLDIDGYQVKDTNNAINLRLQYVF